jgi:hypothetical protein
VKFSGGDFNYDAIVNPLDFNALASRFGTVLAAAAALPEAAATAEDFGAARVPVATAVPTGSLFSNSLVTHLHVDPILDLPVV